MTLQMEISGLGGESQMQGQQGWLPVTGFDWGGKRASRTVTGGSYGMASTFGAVQLREARIKRLSDATTSGLWGQVLAQKPLTVKIRWLRPGSDGEPIHYLEATLSRARLIGISNVSVGERPGETLSFSYEEIEFVVTNIADALFGGNDVVSYEVPTAARR